MQFLDSTFQTAPSPLVSSKMLLPHDATDTFDILTSWFQVSARGLARTQKGASVRPRICLVSELDSFSGLMLLLTIASNARLARGQLNKRPAAAAGQSYFPCPRMDCLLVRSMHATPAHCRVLAGKSGLSLNIACCLNMLICDLPPNHRQEL
jgi:hypothetical protein